MRHPHVVSGHQYQVADFEARIPRRLDHSGDIDATNTRETAHDLARTGRGERVFVIYAGEMRTDDHGTRIKIVER